MSNQSESIMKSNWIQCEILANANEITVKSKWNQNDIKVHSKWIKVKSEWVQSELKVSSKWIHSGSKVKSKWTRSELKVNSKWAPTPLPQILLSSFSWFYRYERYTSWNRLGKCFSEHTQRRKHIFSATPHNSRKNEGQFRRKIYF